MTTISAKAMEWFEGRGIGPDLVARMGIFSGARQGHGDEQAVTPHPNGNLIVFPFHDRGEVAAEKYRAANKRFSQRPNPRKTFFNADVLDDPALADGSAALVIVEGEMDCLSLLQAGYPFAVSVPDGAPPARDKDGRLIVVPDHANDVDPDHDEKYRFIANNWDRLKRIKRIVIATDADEPGQRLAAELVRRLGRVRCSFVAFPDDCKDMNEVLTRHGSARVVDVVMTARQYPVAGVYTYAELPPEPDLQPVSTGWGRLDPFLRVYHPALLVVTGFANHGKSAWTTQLVANLAAIYGWNIAIASFEMRIKPFVTNALLSAFHGRGRSEWTSVDRERGERWLGQHFSFIAPEPDGETVHDIAWFLDKAQAAVLRHGVRVVLLDPWNEIEHARRRDETATEYTNRALREIKDFARRFDVMVIIVAHPTKGATSKSPEELTLYDVADSAAFQNKADLGVVIGRLGDVAHDNLSGIFVKKVRYQPTTGRPGSIEVSFDQTAGVYSQ
jgi:twinkle protein